MSSVVAPREWPSPSITSLFVALPCRARVWLTRGTISLPKSHQDKGKRKGSDSPWPLEKDKNVFIHTLHLPETLNLTWQINCCENNAIIFGSHNCDKVGDCGFPQFFTKTITMHLVKKLCTQVGGWDEREKKKESSTKKVKVIPSRWGLKLLVAWYCCQRSSPCRKSFQILQFVQNRRCPSSLAALEDPFVTVTVWFLWWSVWQWFLLIHQRGLR